MQVICFICVGGYVGYVGVFYDVEFFGQELFFFGVYLYGGLVLVCEYFFVLIDFIMMDWIDFGVVFDLMLLLVDVVEGYCVMDE